MKKLLVLFAISMVAVLTVRVNAAVVKVEFYKGNDAIVSITDIVSLLPAEVSREVGVDGFTGKGHLVGKYSVQMEDGYTFTITVKDELDSVWLRLTGKNILLHVTNDIVLTKNDFTVIFKAIGSISNTATSINMVVGDELYQANSDVPGEYDGQYSIMTNAGDSHSGLITINVIQKNGFDISNPSPNQDYLKWLIPLGAVGLFFFLVMIIRKKF